jgi:acetyl esterase/lipase
MIHKKIMLPVQYRAKGVENNNVIPYMTTYILDNYAEYSTGRKRPVIVICPGGGYEMLSFREAEAVAIKMNSLGYHACVVWYSLKPMTFPAALLDLAEAVYYIRSHADEWNIKKDGIVAAGFSAGGHLAASLGVYWNASLLRKYLPYSAEQIKPDALLLGYPVITAGEFAHTDSIKNVLGNTETYTKADVSLETLVTKDVPPVFMWHTDEDTCVPLENSLLFVTACRRAGIPLEFHVFRRGCHGLSLATPETALPDGNGVQPECSVWPQLFADWLNNLQ